MTPAIRSFWHKTKQYRMIFGFITLVAVIALIIIGYSNDWTGFNAYTKLWIAHMTNSASSPTFIRIEENQPAKTFWDWLQLLGVLAIPVVVGLGTVWFSTQQTRISEVNREQQYKTELQLAENQQQETALQTYIDKISELLLEKKLRKSKSEDEVGQIARVRTLTVLRRLDGERKGSVLRFLYESNLFHIISLREGDLRGANLRTIYLSKADLSFANLEGADLSFAYMRESILVGADLNGANLYLTDLSNAYLKDASVTNEQLDKAKSLQGAIMPNGSTHP